MSKTVKKLDEKTVLERTTSLGSGFEVVDGHHLKNRIRLPDFISALKLATHIGILAEKANHHPDLALGWGYVEVTLFTHSVDGLSEKDFDLATAIAAVLTER